MSGYYAASTIVSAVRVIVVLVIATADANWTQEASQENLQKCKQDIFANLYIPSGRFLLLGLF